MSETQLDHDAVRTRLAAAGCVAADAEATDLLRAAPDEGTLESWLRRRECGEPSAWITGSAQSCGRRILIDPGVYVPRSQSEVLARRAAQVLPPHGGLAADLCTGAGAVAAHLVSHVPTAVVIGTDIDVKAVRCARRNGVAAVVADLGAPLRSASFDVVTAIAPYVPTDSIELLPADVQAFEPRFALDGGRDGLDIVRRVAETAARLLRPGGWLLAEIGGDQGDLLHGPLTELGFAEIEWWFDDDGDLRGFMTQASRIIT